MNEQYMLKVAGKRFSCPRCGVNVFHKAPNGNYRCNNEKCVYGDKGHLEWDGSPEPVEVSE